MIMAHKQFPKIFKSKYGKLPGTSYDELIGLARYEYHLIQKRTPRRKPYVRSKYFTKDKIFINLFWDHLDQKIPIDRVRRLKLYINGIDLIRNSPYAPDTMQNPNNRNESLHRFAGLTASGEKFYVQIKENKRTARKDFISVFPGK